MEIHMNDYTSEYTLEDLHGIGPHAVRMFVRGLKEEGHRRVAILRILRALGLFRSHKLDDSLSHYIHSLFVD